MGDIAKHKTKQQKIFRASSYGVIIDCTRPYKTQKANDYVTKLKIIDEEYNPKEMDPEFRGQKKFFHLFIYTPIIEEAPNISSVGDIIRIKKFEFKSFPAPEGLEWQGKSANLDKGANWLIYSGKENDDLAPISKRTMHDSDDLSIHDKKRIIDLREWISRFFATFSCKSN